MKKEQVIEFMQNGGTLIANENKLTAMIKGYDGTTQKISYNTYLEIERMDVLKIKTVSSDTHIFTYTF